VDAGEGFASLPLQERRTLFFPRDPHWNQKGSNRFAELVLANLPGTSPTVGRISNPSYEAGATASR
jgi:hypothetical protein